MHLTHPPAQQPKSLAQLQAPQNFRSSTTAAEYGKSQFAVAEINTYIAIRDDLLAEAEDTPISAKLKSVAIANDLVEVCLRAPRPTYQAQHLPETDAIRERERCEDVKQRIGALRLCSRD